MHLLCVNYLFKSVADQQAIIITKCSHIMYSPGRTLSSEVIVGEPQGRGRERGPESVRRPTISPWAYERLDLVRQVESGIVYIPKVGSAHCFSTGTD
jgi:hypothetical protein